MNYYCPDCKEIIYDPTRKICGICGAALPREVLLCMALAETWHEKGAELRSAVRWPEANPTPRSRGEAIEKT